MWLLVFFIAIFGGSFVAYGLYNRKQKILEKEGYREERDLGERNETRSKMPTSSKKNGSFFSSKESGGADAPIAQLNKVELKDLGDIIGEEGILRLYCNKNQDKLSKNMIKSIQASAKYIESNPQFGASLIERVNGLDPTQYNDAVLSAVEGAERNPESLELKVVKDVMVACLYCSGFEPENNAVKEANVAVNKR